VVGVATFIDGMSSVRNSQPRAGHVHKSITNFGVVGQPSEADALPGVIHTFLVGSHVAAP
jgi:hypothetical protein